MTKSDRIAARRAELARLLYYGVPTPSRRECAVSLGVTVGTVQSDVRELQRLGLVQTYPGVARTVVFTATGRALATRRPHGR